MSITQARRLSQIQDALLMGTEAHSIKDDGTQTKVALWSPNNFKTMIVCPDRLIVEFHVAPLGKMNKRFMDFPLDVLDEDSKSSVKGVLSLITSESSRAYSNFEEIYVVLNPQLSSELQDKLNLSDLGVAPSDVGKYKEKFPRLHHVAYLQYIDSKQLYLQMNKLYVKLAEMRKIPVHWYSVFEKVLKIKQSPLFHLSSENCYNYCLRENFYMLDKKPLNHQDTSAQLYNHFEKLRLKHEAEIKAQMMADKERLQIQKSFEVLNRIFDTKVPEWLSAYPEVQQFSMHCSPATHKWFNNRLNLLSTIVSYPKSQALVERIESLYKLNYDDIIQKFSLELNPCLESFIQHFNNGLSFVLTPTDKLAYYKKNMLVWLLNTDKDSLVGVENIKSFRDFTEEDLKGLLMLLYAYIDLEHLSMLASICSYCYLNGFTDFDFRDMFLGVNFHISLKSVLQVVSLGLMALGIEKSATELTSDFQSMGLKFGVPVSELDAGLMVSRNKLVGYLKQIIEGKLVPKDRTGLIKDELEVLREYAGLFAYLGKLREVYPQRKKYFQTHRIDVVKLYSEPLQSQYLDILNTVCTEQNDKLLKEMGIDLSLRDLYYLLQDHSGSLKYLNHYLGGTDFNIDFYTPENYKGETKLEDLHGALSGFKEMLYAFMKSLYAILMITIIRYTYSKDDFICSLKVNSFISYFSMVSFWYTRSFSSALLNSDLWSDWEQGVWDQLSPLLNEQGHLILEEDMTVSKVALTLESMLPYFIQILPIQF